jgi:hypothetical protein
MQQRIISAFFFMQLQSTAGYAHSANMVKCVSLAGQDLFYDSKQQRNAGSAHSSCCNEYFCLMLS